MIKKFFSYYKPHLRLFILDMVCALVVAVCNLFYPVIAKDIMNIYVPNQNLQMLIVWGCILLLIYIVKAVMAYVIQYWGHIVGVRIQSDMRMDFFKHIQKMPFSFFDENKTGNIMSRIINDLMDISELAHHGPEDLFLSTVTIIGAFIMLSTINIYLTLIVFAVVPFMILFAVKARNKMSKAFTTMRVETGEVNSEVESAISGIRVSRAYTATEHELSKFQVANGRFASSRAKAYKAMAFFNSGMGFFTDLLYLIVLVAGGLFFFYKIIDVGDFTAYILYITMLINPIRTLTAIFEQIQSGMTGFARFNEIMCQQTEIESKDAISAISVKGDIEFKNVSFHYDSRVADEKLVLRNLNLSITSGSTVALVGPSGGGKTTLCHLIPRFYELTGGEIDIDGIDITKLSRYSLRRNIGIVAQDVFLFGGTIKENIAYGNLEATDEQIIEAAKKANIHDFVMELPNGYDTQVGERGAKLSGGQKQRISIARVFLKNPPILILDEATSALDNITEMQIQTALNSLTIGRTTIVVAHRLSTVKNADEIIVITDKGVMERGTHEQLLSCGGLYAQLYKQQFRE